MKRRELLSSIVATGFAVPALAAQGEHNHKPMSGPLATATVSFGYWPQVPADGRPNGRESVCRAARGWAGRSGQRACAAAVREQDQGWRHDQLHRRRILPDSRLRARHDARGHRRDDACRATASAAGADQPGATAHQRSVRPRVLRPGSTEGAAGGQHLSSAGSAAGVLAGSGRSRPLPCAGPLSRDLRGASALRSRSHARLGQRRAVVASVEGLRPLAEGLRL